ncbi:hypothetical protein IQ06DRAFT_352533 [Phaeosphaeriaceae sp. SRC1lsM3a]|nr:hypothetical protein IQ06DRAFT_352533 [Stagonospora sp. SRC1lsM3a]
MPVLSRMVIAITGTLAADSKDIKKWVEANGGTWSVRVNQHVTHLIASKDAYRNKTDPVVQAKTLRIPIVSYDWLEDSLLKKRRLAEKKYTWKAIKKDKTKRRKFQKLGIEADSTSKPTLRKPKKSKSFFFGSAINTPFVSASENLAERRAKREAAEAAEKATVAAKAAKKASSSVMAQTPIEVEDETPPSHAKSVMPTTPSSVPPAQAASPSTSTPAANTSTVKEINTKRLGLKDYYHYYLDASGFEYKIILVRSNFALNQITRYALSILESHTTPHTYCVLVQYMPPPPQSATSSSPDTSEAKIRNPLLQFLNRSVTESNKPSAPTQTLTMNHTFPDPAEAARLRALITPPQEPSMDRNELARLHSLITPALPDPNKPYRTLVCPMHSSFSEAWRAFRHVFRDLTLLSWEERFEHGKAIQRSRAQALDIEPYIYAKPALGMPVGLLVQEAGLYHGHVGDVVIAGDGEDGYVRNAFKLPGVDEELGRYGVIGSAIWREKEEVRRREEVRREKIEEKERKEREATNEKRRAEHRKPLFNGVMGRPEPSYEIGQMGNGGGYGSAVKKIRPFSTWEYR